MLYDALLSLKKEDEDRIRNQMIDYAMDLAHVFFKDTDEWGDDEWDEWIEKTRELML